MQIVQILEALENLAPFQFAEPWDSVGLLIGNYSAPVSRILLTLDVTSEALLLAERLGSELIVAHHPLIFHPIQQILDDPPQGHLIHRCIRNQKAVLALHTNLDSCLGGVSDALASVLKLKAQESFVPLPELQQEKQQELLKNEVLRSYLGTNYSVTQAGLGRICHLKEGIHAKTFVRRVNNNLQNTGCVVNFDKDKTYTKILVLGGSFDSSWVSLCREKEIDCVVSGEIKHHDLLNLAELGIHAIAAGHETTERCILAPLKRYLELAVPECRVAIYPGLSYNNLVY